MYNIWSTMNREDRSYKKIPCAKHNEIKATEIQPRIS